MLRRLIIFLIRKKLGVKKWEKFRFSNQKSIDIYFFAPDGRLMKYIDSEDWWKTYCSLTGSTVSLNWLLSDECKIIKVDPKGGDTL